MKGTPSMSDTPEQERPWSFYVQDMLDFAEAVLERPISWNVIIIVNIKMAL